MTKTYNKKCAKRGADMIIEYNPEWEDEVMHANKGKVGYPYRDGDIGYAGRHS